MERITADMIAEKEFTIESRGYNKDEVDTFLDLICDIRFTVCRNRIRNNQISSIIHIFHVISL